MTAGLGDAGRYPCPNCPAELDLAELLDHLDAHHQEPRP